MVKLLPFLSFLAFGCRAAWADLQLCQSELDDLCETHFLFHGNPGTCACSENTPEQNVRDGLEEDANASTMKCSSPTGCQPCLDTNTDVCFETGNWKHYTEGSGSQGDYYCYEVGSTRTKICSYFSLSKVCRIDVNGAQCTSCVEDQGVFTADCSNIQNGAVLTFLDPNSGGADFSQMTTGFKGTVFEPIAEIINGPANARCSVADVKVEDVCGLDNVGGSDPDNGESSGTSDWNVAFSMLVPLLTHYLFL